MNTMNLLLVPALAAFAAVSQAADSFTLVADGQANAQIVTGEDAPETVRFAAKELRTFVAENRMWELRMRGATFQIPLNHYPSATDWAGRFGQTHPEYFALLGGVRNAAKGHEDGHLCYTEPVFGCNPCGRKRSGGGFRLSPATKSSDPRAPGRPREVRDDAE